MSTVVERRGAGLAWREVGTGETVVFLHGLGGTATSWAAQLDALATNRRCVAWDMPGYGDSDPVDPSVAMTFEWVADRLVDLLDELAIARADLVGLSLGGMHALHAALRHPDRVDRLVLTNTSPRFGLNGTTADEWTASRLAVLDEGMTLRELAPNVLDGLVASPLPPSRRSDLIESFARIPEPGFRAAVACLPTHDVLARLNGIRCPTLVIAGELDTETPPSYSRALADGIPDARLEVLPGVGHLAPSENADMFNRLVAAFLDNSGAGSR